MTATKTLTADAAALIALQVSGEHVLRCRECRKCCGCFQCRRRKAPVRLCPMGERLNDAAAAATAAAMESAQ